MVTDTREDHVLMLLDKHIQSCRDAVSKCPKWSPAQGEWLRAQCALLNFRDDLLEAAETPAPLSHTGVSDE